jgi:hypothetical protein
VGVGLGVGVGHSGFCCRVSRVMICSASVRLSAGMPSCTCRRATWTRSSSRIGLVSTTE